MRLRIVFDSEAISPSYEPGFGLSILLDETTLFDTGSSGNALLRNLEELGADINALHQVVISHEHWDHIDGLWELLERRKGLRVVICPGFSRECASRIAATGNTVVEANEAMQLEGSLYTTGELAGKYADTSIAEQALVLCNRGEATMVTGCAHFGIADILPTVRKRLERHLGRPMAITGLVGGFHLRHHDSSALAEVIRALRQQGIRDVVPLHCTGSTASAALAESYADHCRILRVGDATVL